MDSLHRIVRLVASGVFVLAAADSTAARAQCVIPVLYSVSTVTEAGNFVLPAQTGAAATSTGDATFSSTVRACNHDWVSYLEWDFAKPLQGWINESSWSDKGHSTPCDRDLMYGRFLNGAFVLGTSYPGSANASGVLEDALDYSMEHLESVTGRCSWETYIMQTSSGSWTRVPKNAVYQWTPAVRAAVLYHEARHGAGYSHDGNDGSPQCDANSESCDERYGSSQDPFTPGPNASSWGVYFAADYVFRGVLRRTDTTTISAAPLMQRRTTQRYANNRLATYFDQKTSLRVNSTTFCNVPATNCPLNI
jgi:hypothetical protein